MKNKVLNLFIEVGTNIDDAEIIEIPIPPQKQREIMNTLNKGTWIQKQNKKWSEKKK